jgi:hypothetical protein
LAFFEAKMANELDFGLYDKISNKDLNRLLDAVNRSTQTTKEEREAAPEEYEFSCFEAVTANQVAKTYKDNLIAFALSCFPEIDDTNRETVENLFENINDKYASRKCLINIKDKIIPSKK